MHTFAKPHNPTHTSGFAKEGNIANTYKSVLKFLSVWNMTDVHDKKTRSYNMSQIKGRDTKPEVLIRKFLFSKGFRYRLYDKKLPGKPDIVLPKYKTVIFIHGCFWHGHENCKYFVIPKTRTDWWIKKIDRNKKLDCDNFQLLKELGWNVLIIFECELKKNKRDKTLNELITKIH